jgi:uncharacterized protein with HEPN domain
MPSKPRKWTLRVRHILDAIAESIRFAAGMSRSEFEADAKTAKAVVCNLGIIGEAARHIPKSTEASYPQVPWAQMRGMRNHLIHGYDVIDLEIVWHVLSDELPKVAALLEKVLEEAAE